VLKVIERGGTGLDNKFAYLMRTVRNTFIDGTRAAARLVSLDPEDASDGAANADVRDLDDVLIKRSEVDALLGRLNPAERELLFLVAVEEYTASDAAVHYGAPRGTILARLHRLKARLRRLTGEPKQEVTP